MILTSWYSLVKKELYQNVLRIVSETAKGIEKKKKCHRLLHRAWSSELLVFNIRLEKLILFLQRKQFSRQLQ